MKQTKAVFVLLTLLMASAPMTPAAPRQDVLNRGDFANPPLSARPGAFWPWLNGKVSLDRLTYELEEMKDKGMRGADIWDVASISDPGKIIPAGPAFLGEESLQAISHAIKQANRLGLSLGMVAASGWNAGGSWIEPANAGMGLFHSELTVVGPVAFSGELPFPKVPALCPKDSAGRPSCYREVAVYAWPNPETQKLVPKASIVKLAAHFDSRGKLSWNVPAGKWTIFRCIMANTGHQLIVPSPKSGGPMIDFLNPDATRYHFQYIVDRLESKLGKLENSALKYLEVDSMELGDETAWTGRMLDEFVRQHHYDPFLYLPALKGWTVESEEVSRRFLYDWQKTISDVFIDSHYRAGKELLNRHGLQLCAEAGGPGAPVWDSCPVESLKALGAVDIMRGEFWPKHRNLRVVKEVASAAHIYGKSVVDAEAFTSWRHWQDGPYIHKQLADIALGEGLNRFTFHTFTHSPTEAGLPGWAYHAGTHINPNVAWWPMARPFIDYLSRCSYMLQQGLFVADACYYYGDQAPNFVPSKNIKFCPGSGYDYDVINSDVILNRMTVKNRRLVLPDGMSYALLVLPEQADMDIEVLRKLESLIKAGATVVGPKPTRTGTLQEYPRRDAQVAMLADKIWGNCNGQDIKEQAYGKGQVVWNRSVAEILSAAGIGPDFSYRGADGRARLDYLHRRAKDADIYFVSNMQERWEDVDCVFRVKGKQPELWHPETGEVRTFPVYETAKDQTRLTLHLAPAESVFVVFKKPAAATHFTRLERLGASASTLTPVLFANSDTPGGPMWLSDGKAGPAAQHITFDLGAVKDLRKVRVWNYNDHARGNLNYGVKAMDVRVSTDNSTYRQCGSFSIRIAPESEEREYWQDLDVKADGIRYVQFGIKSNQDRGDFLDGHSPYVGLSKVSFFDQVEITGVRVESVSSGTAFHPASDSALGVLHPGAEVWIEKNQTPHLKAWESGIYVLYDTKGRSRKVEATSVARPLEITGPWQVHFPKGWGAPESTTFDKLMSWTDAVDDGIKYFSGRAVYRKNVEVAGELLEAGARLELDLGAVQQVAKVTLNDRLLGILWKPPFCIDITDAVHAGQNTLVVEVANTWANRLTGDAFLPLEQQYSKSNMHQRLARKENRLRPSGLLGPVRIIQAKRVKL
jgi:hypothetical protein